MWSPSGPPNSSPSPTRPPSGSPWDTFAPSEHRSSPLQIPSVSNITQSDIHCMSNPANSDSSGSGTAHHFYSGFEGGGRLPSDGPHPASMMMQPGQEHMMLQQNGATSNGHGHPPQPLLSAPNRPCAGCGMTITDRYFLHAMDRYWHNSCLKCSLCHTPLADIGSSCFFKNDMILCKNDYVRMFGNAGACAACGQTIPPSDYVLRAPPHGSVYHLKCFSCVKCHSQLMPGDRYNLLNGSILCEQDCIKMLKLGPNGGPLGGPGGGPTPPTGGPPVRKGGAKMRGVPAIKV